jgi:hypothetical protein
VRAGDDSLAKEALRRRGEKEAERTETQKSLQEQGVYVDQLATALKALGGAGQGRQAPAGDAARAGPGRQGGVAPVQQDHGVR